MSYLPDRLTAEASPARSLRSRKQAAGGRIDIGVRAALRQPSMKRPELGRAGKQIRGGAGRSRMRKLRPDARPTPVAAPKAASAPAPKPRLHDVTDGACACGWRGPMGLEAVQHVFSGR